MGKYIDVELFLKNVKQNAPYIYIMVATMALTSPTVDAVEVVRCKDCKHRNKMGVCGEFRQRFPFFPEDNFYCGFGDRKDDR